MLISRALRVTAATSMVAVPLLVSPLSVTPAWADDGQCTFPSKPYTGRPWALQRVNLDELWAQSTGKNVKVAVIDTGVDVKNPQLTKAVDASAGENLLPAKNAKGETIDRGNKQGTTDTVGHGTRVAGIIAARPAKGTGFVGLAPDATIIPIKQNDAEGDGTAATLATAIRDAVGKGAGVINISQDTANAVAPADSLEDAVNYALSRNVVVVASAGNDGLGGNVQITYPASYEGVLAVAASDRNNERASFSQSGEFVGVAAPGVDMVSTVPGNGHCSDNGTSFSAPYVAGVAALLKSKYPKWSAQQIVAQIEQTAERSISGHDRLVGWGVVDPVKALTDVDPEHPVATPEPEGAWPRAKAPSGSGVA
ncbi:type VII secretion-associated serine protease mycosin, partial [Streptomyces sp. MBT65]|uniref:type VII secretion-associated serine protease mycosin n=1 Tax=Streptomyces sp. MBT65 TaxID=1488395 RepID=UPI00190C77A2